MIYSIQVDFLFTRVKHVPLVSHITYWHSHFHRPKPPWLFIGCINVNVNTRKLGIYSNSVIIGTQSNTTKKTFFNLYPFFSNDLSILLAISLLGSLLFHTELALCAIRMNLAILILVNISRFSHIKKPPWLLSFLRHGLSSPRASSARQLQILIFLLMLQAVQALDLRTCHLLDAMVICSLLLLCWRPYIVIIIVTPVVVLPLLWLAAYSAYRALFDLLVNFATHLIFVHGNFHRALSDTLVKITVYLILLSFGGAVLLILCVEGLGLDLHALPDCLVVVFNQAGTLDMFTEVYSQAATHAQSTDEATSQDGFCTRTLSTDSLDSLGTLDTVTTTSEASSTLTHFPNSTLDSVERWTPRAQVDMTSWRRSMGLSGLAHCHLPLPIPWWNRILRLPRSVRLQVH